MRKQAAGSRRTWRSAAAAFVLLLILILPWNTQVRVPAVVEPALYARLYPTAPAQITEVRVKPGDVVNANDVLLVMDSPKLDKELEVTNARLAIVEQRMARRLGDPKDQAASLSLDKERLSLLERRHALQHQIQTLAIRAPISGRVVDLDPNLHKGRLLSRDADIGVIVGNADKVIRGYADQEDLWRVSPGEKAKFIPDDAQIAAVPASLVTVAPTASAAIEIPELAEPHGGRVRTYPAQGKNPLAPIDPVHLLTFAPSQSIPVHRTIRGLVVVSGAPQSLLASSLKRALKVLVQEMGV